MGLHIEIVERQSVIVVKLSGPTGLASLNPLQAAVSAAISDGQEVVVDLTELAGADLGSLARLIEDLGPSAAAHLKVVDSRPRLADQSPNPNTVQLGSQWCSLTVCLATVGGSLRRTGGSPTWSRWGC
jgi:hypothetical protein